MINYSNCRGRLIKMTEPYPIYDREFGDDIIGHTKSGDMAAITYSNFKEDYHEVTIVSGEYIGVDTLALNNHDLYNSIFVINNIDDYSMVYVNGRKVNSELI